MNNQAFIKCKNTGANNKKVPQKEETNQTQ